MKKREFKNGVRFTIEGKPETVYEYSGGVVYHGICSVAGKVFAVESYHVTFTFKMMGKPIFWDVKFSEMKKV